MAGRNNTEGVSFDLTYGNFPVFIITIVGVASNVLLLVAFGKDPLKCFRNSGTYLVMNLSVTDCLTCVLAPFSHAITIADSRLIFEYLLQWMASVSLALILAVSIDRFILVAYPIRHHALVNGKLIALWLAAAWVVSFILPVLRWIASSTWNFKTKNTSNCVFVIIIIIFSALFYASTYYKLKKQSRNIASQVSNESRAQQLRLLKETQFLKTIMLVACIAFVCTVPSMTFFQITDILAVRKDIPVFQTFSKIFMCLFYINFAVNPFIYVIRFPNYRKTFHILFYKKGL